MTLIRRCLVLAAVMFWQGGFTFYAAVVIHVGKQVLGSHLQQGLVTRSVTNYLNMAGLIAILLWGWDIASTRDPVRYRRYLRWIFLTLLALILVFLAWLHPRLDDLVDLDSPGILNRPSFRELHTWYLNSSTVQWAGSLIQAALTLMAWRAEDQATSRAALDTELALDIKKTTKNSF
jgi:hypothetical protein